MNPDDNMHHATVATRVAPAAAGIATLAASWASAAGSRVKLLSELALAEAKLAAISLAILVNLMSATRTESLQDQ